jgi:hypothetical protein
VRNLAPHSKLQTHLSTVIKQFSINSRIFLVKFKWRIRAESLGFWPMLFAL